MGGKDLANNVGLALNGRNVVSDTLIYFKYIYIDIDGRAHIEGQGHKLSIFPYL